MTNPYLEQTNGKKARLQPVDYAGIALLVAFFLIVSYLRSRNCMFWGDEIFGSMTLRQPTWPDLLKFWRAGIDSSGIWFYVFGRPWTDLFGASEVSLRMYSAAGIAASAAVIWIVARRFYSTLPVAAAIVFIYTSTPQLRWQLANGRSYGVFMLACALLLYLILRGQDEPATRQSPLFLLATFAAYALLAGSHILGSLYCAAFLGIQIALDLVSRRFRPLLYLSAACASGLVVLFSLTNLRATAALGKPSFWTARPNFHDLLMSRVFVKPHVSHVFEMTLCLTVLFLQVRRKRIPVYVILLGFVALDVAFFAISRATTSIYVDRYLMPFCFAEILLLCELFTQLREADAPHPRLRAWIPAVLFLLSAAYFFVPRYQVKLLPYPNYTAGLLATLPAGIPVIDSDVASFVEVEFYHPGAIGRPWYFPVDWAVALDPINHGGVSGNHEMDNLKALGVYSSDIVPSETLLAQNREFIVLCHSWDLWFARRIVADPRFKITKVGTYMVNLADRSPMDIWLVTVAQ